MSVYENWSPSGAGRSEQVPVCLVDRIRAEARSCPERPAVADQSGSWTFGEFAGAVGRLAGVLADAGACSGALVGVCLPRDRRMVSALLAIWTVGGAYVPLDAAYPRGRLALMASDSRLSILLTTRALADRVPVDDSVSVVCIDELDGPPFPDEDGWPDPLAGPADLAYVIYTSGSTGRPKGVMIEHRNVSNVVDSFAADPGFGEDDTMLALTSLSFDIAGLELFLPLTVGGRLVVAPAGAGGDPQVLRDLLYEHQITVVQATPATWQLYAGYGGGVPPCLRQIWCGGEEMTPKLAKLLVGMQVEVHNLYGPTETTIWSTRARLNGQGVSIGRPIANTGVYVVDERGRPATDAVPGELWITGAGVGRGYLNLPELTGERFVENVFDSLSTHAYRTGDMVSWNHDHTLRYLGRMDHQIKINGHRVELGEIDRSLVGHPAVRDSVTIASPVAPGTRQLVTFVVPQVRDDAAEADDRVRRWGTVYDQAYARGDQPAAGDLNLRGWTSSYTSAPLPVAEARHCIDTAVAAVSRLGARTFLEIGCGTGLLLLRLARSCERYVGLDLSQNGLDHVAAEVGNAGFQDRVELIRAGATEITRAAAGRRFDCVIINSVAQYFPSESYLTEVLTQSTRIVTPGGFVFVGDLRNPHLAAAFHASVLQHQSTLDPMVLAMRAERRALEEDELLIAPDYFTVLRRSIPTVTGVQTTIKPEGPDNEFTRFRYDALLQIDGGPPLTTAGQLDWERDIGTMDRLAELLRRATGDFTVDNVPNLRTHRFAQLLDPGDGGRVEAIPPEAVTDVARRHGWRTHHAWSWANRRQGRVRTTFYRLDGTGRAPLVDVPTPVDQPTTNDPRVGPLLRSLPREALGWLRKRLPGYMLPSQIVTLVNLPLTPNGKIDREALRATAARLSRASAMDTRVGLPAAADTPALTPLEQAVTRCWSELLDIGAIAPEQNFFELGGGSLLAVEAMIRLQRQLARRMPLMAIFDAPTVRELARLVELGHSDEPAGPSPSDRTGRLPLSGPQAAFWYLDHYRHAGAARRSSFADAVHYRIRGPLDVPALAEALRRLMIRQEALRTRLDLSASGGYQEVLSPSRDVLTTVDVGAAANPDAAAWDAVGQLLAVPLDPACGRVLHAGIVLGSASIHLLLRVHHMVSDSWSMGVIERELADHYRAVISGQTKQLAPLPLQYGDFARWQDNTFFADRHWQQSPTYQGASDYWHRIAQGLRPVSLPEAAMVSSVPAGTTAGSELLRRTIDPCPTDRIRALAKAQQTTPFTVLLTAFANALRARGGEDDVRVLALHAARPFPELDSLVGLFTEPVLIRLRLDGRNASEQLRAAREAVHAAMARARVPLLAICDESDDLTKFYLESRLIGFSYLPPVAGLRLPGLTIDRLDPLDPDYPGEPLSYPADLLLSAQDRGDLIRVALSFDTGVVKASYAAGLLDEFVAATHAITGTTG